MNSYVKGLMTGLVLSISLIMFIGASNQKLQVGRYDYYISDDDITKKHSSRIFDSATGTQSADIAASAKLLVEENKASVFSFGTEE